MSQIRVQVADWAVARGDGTISTVGLGSCVAIALYDRVAQVGGLAHILLPAPSVSRDTSNPAKFPQTAVPLLLAEMRRLGAGPASAMSARIVGGASMFAALAPAGGGLNIGERNVVATRQVLASAGLRLVAEDVGGEHGRSVFLHLHDGRLEVRSLRGGTRVL